MRRGPFAIVASVCAVMIFAGLNLASARWLAAARVDLTGARLYTLSSSARTVLGRLVEPVELELVYSRGVAASFPAVRMHGTRVRELLNEIAVRSGGKVRIVETDPEPFSEEEDRVAAAGVSPAPVDGGDPLYFGIIGRNSVADEIAIPFLAPERDGQLEYDLIRLVAQLDDPAPPRVAVISSLPAFSGDGTGEGDAFILQEMRRAFEIIPVENGFRQLPRDADLLLIVHPPALDIWQLYQIDQFLLRKGRALIALDPVSRAALARQGARAVVTSTLGRIETALGVTLDASALADRTLALPVEVDAGGGRRVVEGQPLFIAAPVALMSSDDMITADLSRSVNFGAAGRWVGGAGKGARFTPLVESTPDASLMAIDFAASDPGPRAVIGAYSSLGSRQILAGRLSGRIETAFPEGPPQSAVPEDPLLAALARDEIAAAAPHIGASEQDAEIVMIADADMLDDGFYINPDGGQPVADNGAFVLNALDNLAGDPALVALRSRAPASRPMTRVDDLRAVASERLYGEQAALEKRLADTEGRLAELETARNAAGAALGRRLATDERQDDEIAAFRTEVSEIRGRLRAIEREFRRDIDTLAGRLQLANVWLPPLFIAAAGLLVFAARNRRRGGVA
ncbi:MAG: GldG family protein [Alphaproteobacteria bacterium]|nr:GldG family protein [Alphaproteobacteria bacterium]